MRRPAEQSIEILRADIDTRIIYSVGRSFSPSNDSLEEGFTFVRKRTWSSLTGILSQFRWNREQSIRISTGTNVPLCILSRFRRDPAEILREDFSVQIQFFWYLTRQTYKFNVSFHSYSISDSITISYYWSKKRELIITIINIDINMWW